MNSYLNLELKSLYSVKFYSILLISILFAFVLFIPNLAKAETTIPLCEITRNLKQGDSGEDVRCLQRYLNWAGYTISATGVGSPGNETQYFGSLTKNALIKWQNANSTQVLTPVGLATGSGFWGPQSFNWYVSIVRSQLGLSS